MLVERDFDHGMCAKVTCKISTYSCHSVFLHTVFETYNVTWLWHRISSVSSNMLTKTARFDNLSSRLMKSSAIIKMSSWDKTYKYMTTPTRPLRQIWTGNPVVEWLAYTCMSSRVTNIQVMCERSWSTTINAAFTRARPSLSISVRTPTMTTYL